MLGLLCCLKLILFESQITSIQGTICAKISQISTWWQGGDLMTHNCRKLEKYLFRGRTGCIFDPWIGGPGDSSYPEGSEYVWQRGVGGQKCLVLGNFQSVPRYRKRTDQILTKAARNQALLTPYPTLPYIFWTLWIWGITGTPYSWVKNAPSTAAKQILLKFSAIVGH